MGVVPLDTKRVDIVQLGGQTKQLRKHLGRWNSFWGLRFYVGFGIQSIPWIKKTTYCQLGGVLFEFLFTSLHEVVSCGWIEILIVASCLTQQPSGHGLYNPWVYLSPSHPKLCSAKLVMIMPRSSKIWAHQNDWKTSSTIFCVWEIQKKIKKNISL